MRDKTLTSAPAMHGRRERRKQMTRRQLLAAGRRLFGEKGLYDSRIEDLTSVAGIAKGTLYGYFADKESLIRAVVGDGFQELRAFVHQAAGTHRGEARVRAVVRAHLEFFAAHPDLMRIFHQVRGMLTFHRPEWRGLRDALEGYLNDLAKLLEPGPVRAGAPSRVWLEAAHLLFGAVSGVTSIRAALEIALPSPVSTAGTVAAIAAMVAGAARDSIGRNIGPPRRTPARTRNAPGPSARSRAAGAAK